MNPMQLNIRNEQGQLLCPCCGFANYTNDRAYDEFGGIVGVVICPCCLWEPGFDDAPAASATAKGTIVESLRDYRAEWMLDCAWRGHEQRRPNNWNPNIQIEALLTLAPFVK